jgi:hypothetical protein
MRFRARRLGFAACAAVLLAAGCGPSAPSPAAWPEPTHSPAPADERDAAVYRAVLAGAPTRTVLRPTGSPSLFTDDVPNSIAANAPNLPGLDPGTARSFLDLDRTQTSLPELGDFSVVWVSEAEWRASMESVDARRMERWRHGVMRLSRIGYSDDRTQALVYVAHVCPLCGSGGYVLLARTGGRWSIVAESQDWVS